MEYNQDQNPDVEENAAEPEVDASEADADQDNDGGQDDQADASAESDEGDYRDSDISFGDKEPEEKNEEPAPDWVKDLRKQNREQAKEIAKLKKQQEVKTEEQQPLGAKPNIADFEFDQAAFDTAYEEWHVDKAEHDKRAKSQGEAAATQKDAWEKQAVAFSNELKRFNPETAEDASHKVQQSLNDTQQSIIIDLLGKDAAPLIIGLGSDDKQLQELAAIKSNVRFAAAITRLETKMNTRKRKPLTSPEDRIKGNKPVNLGSGDEKLNEARESGNIKEVMRLRRKSNGGQ